MRPYTCINKAYFNQGYENFYPDMRKQSLF